MLDHSVAAAILAGGRARRFGGRDKSRLVVEGRPIIVRQLDVLQRVAAPVYVIGSDPERFADLPVIACRDAVDGAGALGGIYTAVVTAGDAPVIVVACDHPFLEAGLLRRLAELSAGHDGAWVRTPLGIEPLLACYRPSALDVIRTQIAAGDLKAADLDGVLRMAAMDVAEVMRFGPVERLLANLNTPEDYARIAG